MSLTVLLYLLLLLPLMSFVLLTVVGRRMGEPLSGYVGLGFSFIGFVVAVSLMVVWIYGGTGWGFQVAPFERLFRWLPIHFGSSGAPNSFLDVGIYIDSLTVVMLAMVSLVGLAVHLFSIGYMRFDPRYAKFFAYLSLFIFAMTGLLVSGSLLQLLVFWELVGVCSYLLIGFWHEDAGPRHAAIKAFVMNRVGDVGFIIGLAMIVARVGTTNLPTLWQILNPQTQQAMSPIFLTIVGVLLACGAVAKSAQFPLHGWLIDAMAGPTPVSALIHAATMVAAGVFLLARISPILTADARLFIIIIGATTIGIGSLCALAQRDLKRVLAFSTIAQLGYMVLGIGIGSWTGPCFHLLTHAFCKALLFLCAGMVIHAMHHETRMEKFGGLFKRLPVTAVTFAIAALAMSGAPFTSGFFSKEILLAHASAWTALADEEGRAWLLQLVLWVPVIGAYLTPIYLARAWMLTFTGRSRDRFLFNKATEPGVMSFPLVLLAGLSIVAGYQWFPVQSMVNGALVEMHAQPDMSTIATRHAPVIWPTPLIGSTEPPPEGTDAAETVPEASDLDRRVADGVNRAYHLTHWAWLAGALFGIIVYAGAFAITDRLTRFKPFAAIKYWLSAGMFFDDLYDLVFVGAIRLLSGIWTSIDDRLIDPLINAIAHGAARVGRMVAAMDDLVVDGAVRGIALAAERGGGAVQVTQGGRVRVYIACAIATIALVVGGVVWSMVF